MPIAFNSLDFEDLHDTRAALRDYLLWLEQKTNFSVESGNLSSESDVESCVGVSFVSPRRPSLKHNDRNIDEKIENRSISPYRVSFEDSRNTDDNYSDESKESVTALVKRTKSLSSNIISDREDLKDDRTNTKIECLPVPPLPFPAEGVVEQRPAAFQ